MGEEDKKKRDLENIFSLKIFGFDIGQLIKSWTGVADMDALMKDPGRLENLKEMLEQKRSEFRKTQSVISEKFGDAVRFDYDIRIGSLLGNDKDLRIGGGQFFQRLDGLAKTRARPQSRIRVSGTSDAEEPLVDVLREDGHLKVVAEMPGIEEKDIEVNMTGQKLTLTATGARKYRAEVDLPIKVSPSISERLYRNGILELKLKVEE